MSDQKRFLITMFIGIYIGLSYIFNYYHIRTSRVWKTETTDVRVYAFVMSPISFPFTFCSRIINYDYHETLR